MNINPHIIYSNDCLGDALPKINANLQSQDILTCNLLSRIETLDANLTDFANVSAYIDKQLIYLRDNFNKFNTAYSTASKLYPYWSAKQFTIYLPPHLFPPGITNLPEIIRTSYLNNNLSPSLYEDFTIINAIKTDFNKIKQPITTLNTDIKELSHTIYRYINVDKMWRYADTILCPVAPQAMLSTDTFNEFFNLQINKIEKINNKIKIELLCNLITEEGIENLSDNDLISWDWSIPSIDNNTIPISGYSIATYDNIQVKGVVNRAGEANLIVVEIDPPTFTQTPNTNIIHITSLLYSNKYTQTATVTAALIDVPDVSLFNIEYDIYEFIYPIGDASINTITRVYDLNKLYKFTIKPKINTKPHTSEYTIKWIIREGEDYTEYIGEELTFTLSKLGLTTVTCSVTVDSIVWGDVNNLRKTINFYLLEKSIEPIDFIVFGKTLWSPTRIDISPEEFYKYKPKPVSIRNKKNNTEFFYVSATPDIYDTYVWQVGSMLYKTTSSVSLLEIPYEEGLNNENGINIRLTAYNAYYPESNNTVYSYTSFGIQTNPITATTYSEHSNDFKKNPRLIDYGTYQLQFTTNTYNIDIASNSNTISINQTISSIDSLIYIVDGVVNYTLSSTHWVAGVSALPVNGVYDLFCLKTGDSTIPLQVDSSGCTDLILSACAVLNVNIDKDWQTVQQIVCASLLDETAENETGGNISSDQKITIFNHPRPTQTTTPSVTPTPGGTPPVTQTCTNTPTVTQTVTNTPTKTQTQTPSITPSSPIVSCPCRGVTLPPITMTGISVTDGSPAPALTYTPYTTYDKHSFVIRSFISTEYTNEEKEIIMDALDYWACVLKNTILPAQEQPEAVILGLDNTNIYTNPIKLIPNAGFVLFISKNTSAPAGFAGAASYFYSRSALSDQNQTYYRLPSMGYFWGASSYIESAKNNITPKRKSGLYYMILHEVAHTLGFGSVWHITAEDNTISRSLLVGYKDITDPGWNDPSWLEDYDGVSRGESLHANVYYTTDVDNTQSNTIHEPDVSSVVQGSGDWVLNMRGCAGRDRAINLNYPARSISKAVSAYNDCFGFTGSSRLTAIPVENFATESSGSFSAASFGCHWPEGTFIPWGDQRCAICTSSTPLPAPALQDELMTPQAEENNYDNPVSKITLGALEDIGWTVDYSLADDYYPLIHRIAYTPDLSKNELIVKKYNTGGYISPIIVPVAGLPDARVYQHLRAGMTYKIINETGDTLTFTESDAWGSTILAGTIFSSSEREFNFDVPIAPPWNQIKMPWKKTSPLRFIHMSTPSTTVKNVWIVY